MALMPKRVKHRKVQRGKIRGNATRGNFVAFGDFGIAATQPGWITARQIEAARISANQALAGEGKVLIRIFPDKPITSTPAETRMGKGKGAPEYFVAVVRPGRILFEVAGVSHIIAKEALRLAAQKLPVKTKFIIANDYSKEN